MTARHRTAHTVVGYEYYGVQGTDHHGHFALFPGVLIRMIVLAPSAWETIEYAGLTWSHMHMMRQEVHALHRHMHHAHVRG